MKPLAFTTALICVLAPAAVFAQSSPPASSVPSPLQQTPSTPGTYDHDRDSAYQQCYQKARTDSDADVTNDDPATNPYWQSSMLQCLADAKDYVGAADLAHAVLKDLNDDRHTQILDVDGSFYYSVALSLWKTGDTNNARRYLDIAYKEALANSFGDCHTTKRCMQDRRLMLTINVANQKALERRFAADDHAQTKQIENEIARDEAGMSDDQKQVYENESLTLPCHKEVYDHGDNYHRVTWWYCDDQGHYRKAYTFLNGTLTDTFTP